MTKKKYDQQMQDLQRKYEEALRKLDALVDQLRDRQALETFRARSAAGYFNQAAARDPQQAPEYRRLAEVAATVDVDKMRGDAAAYKPGEEVNREWHIARERFRDEINRAAGAHIQDFAAQEPERWKRLQRHSPALVEKLKPPKTISINIKL